MKKQVTSLILFTILLLCFVNMTCDNEDGSNDYNGKCDQAAIVDSALYKNLQTDHFTFIDTEIKYDCLNIEIGASGCSGNSWGFKLIDSGAVAESLPEQRYLKFQLKNEEDCLAYFTRTISFDLSALKVEGSNEIILNIEGLEYALNYKY